MPLLTDRPQPLRVRGELSFLRRQYSRRDSPFLLSYSRPAFRSLQGTAFFYIRQELAGMFEAKNIKISEMEDLPVKLQATGAVSSCETFEARSGNCFLTRTAHAGQQLVNKKGKLPANVNPPALTTRLRTTNAPVLRRAASRLSRLTNTAGRTLTTKPYLHKGRFVILFRYRAFIHARSYMYGFICGPQRKPHCKTHPFGSNLSFAVNTFTVFRLFIRRY